MGLVLRRQPGGEADEFRAEHRVDDDPLGSDGGVGHACPSLHAVPQIEVVRGSKPLGSGCRQGRVHRVVGRLAGPGGKRRIEQPRFDSLVHEHAPRRELFRILACERSLPHRADVVEATCDLPAESRDPHTLVEAALSNGQSGEGDRIRHPVQSHRRIPRKVPCVRGAQLVESGQAVDIVSQSVSLGELPGNDDIASAGHTQRHRPEPTPSGTGDGAEQQSGILPAGELQHRLGVVIQERFQRSTQHPSRPGHCLLEGDPCLIHLFRRAYSHAIGGKVGDRPGCEFVDPPEQRALAELPPEQGLDGDRGVVEFGAADPTREQCRRGEHRCTGSLRGTVIELTEPHRVGDHGHAPLVAAHGGKGRE